MLVNTNLYSARSALCHSWIRPNRKTCTCHSQDVSNDFFFPDVFVLLLSHSLKTLLFKEARLERVRNSQEKVAYTYLFLGEAHEQC